MRARPWVFVPFFGFLLLAASAAWAGSVPKFTPIGPRDEDSSIGHICALDDGVVVRLSLGRYLKIGFDDRVQWRGPEDEGAFNVESNGRDVVVVATKTNGVRALNRDGSLRFAAQLPSPKDDWVARIGVSQIAISADGHVAVTTQNPGVCVYSPTGELVAHHKVGYHPRSVLCDETNRQFVFFEGWRLRRLGFDGQLRTREIEEEHADIPFRRQAAIQRDGWLAFTLKATDVILQSPKGAMVICELGQGEIIQITATSDGEFLLLSRHGAILRLEPSEQRVRILHEGIAGQRLPDVRTDLIPLPDRSVMWVASNGAAPDFYRWVPGEVIQNFAGSWVGFTQRTLIPTPRGTYSIFQGAALCLIKW